MNHAASTQMHLSAADKSKPSQTVPLIGSCKRGSTTCWAKGNGCQEFSSLRPWLSLSCDPPSSSRRSSGEPGWAGSQLRGVSGIQRFLSSAPHRSWAFLPYCFPAHPAATVLVHSLVFIWCVKQMGLLLLRGEKPSTHVLCLIK